MLRQELLHANRKMEEDIQARHSLAKRRSRSVAARSVVGLMLPG